jgi:hypothetical protein
MSSMPLSPLFPLVASLLATLVPTQETWSQGQLETATARIMKDIEELRGKKFLRAVDTSLTNREEFIEHAKARIASMVPAEQLLGSEVMAKMLSLIPPEMDLMATTFEILEEQVGGYYDPQADTFYLMESFTGPMAEIILAHELTHALDDQLFDLDGGLRARIEDSDASAAYSAVVEGSGTSAMNQMGPPISVLLDGKQYIIVTGAQAAAAGGGGGGRGAGGGAAAPAGGQDGAAPAAPAGPRPALLMMLALDRKTPIPGAAQ